MNGDLRCVNYPNGCSNGIYNNITKEFECSECLSGFTFNDNNTCILCGDGCNSCLFESGNENNTICSSCYSGYYLYDNQCHYCGEGCIECELDVNTTFTNISKLECNLCFYNFVLSPEKECIQCIDIPKIGGEGCEHCTYNENITQYECLECFNNNYSFIQSSYQCLNNTNPNQTDLYGCVNAIFNKEKNRYECSECKFNFTLIKNESRCINMKDVNLSSKCVEIGNIGNLENSFYFLVLNVNIITH